MSDLEALRSFWGEEFENWKTRGSKEGYGAELVSLRLEAKIADGADVLEIGSGDGRWLELLARSRARPYGIDILPKAAGSASLRGFPVCVGDARDLPFPDNHFDLTCSFGVFEHFEGTERAISEQIRVTKPGGRAIITLPHLYSPYTLLMALWHLLHGTWKLRPASYGKRYREYNVLEMLSTLPCAVIDIEPFYIGAICEVRAFRFLRRFLLEKVERSPPLRRFLGLMLWIEVVRS